MSTLLQFLANGLILGSVYILFALGLTLVLGIFNILNIAHGEIFTWGTLAAYFVAISSNLNLFEAIAIGAVTSALLSTCIYWIAYRPLEGRGRDWDLSTLIASLAISFILLSGAQLVTHARDVSFPTGVGNVRPFSISSLVTLTDLQAIILGVSIALAASLAFALRYTMWGTQVRTVATNKEIAALMGVNVAVITTSVFFISGFLSGAAGVLTAVAFTQVNFAIGQHLMLKGMAILILGGFGSVPGAVIGGLIIGVVEALSVGYVSSSVKDILVFAVLLGVLVARGGGLVKSELGLRV